MTTLPLESSALACEGVITAVAVLSQVLEVQRVAPDDPQTPDAVNLLLEAYAVACSAAGDVGEA
jgi:hypothetical protein|tara:strand:- start:201 stop:392 length:192 start_codon:yes stop_codon:yes gene_type:complete